MHVVVLVIAQSVSRFYSPYLKMLLADGPARGGTALRFLGP